MSSQFDTEDDLSLRTRRGAEDRAANRDRSSEMMDDGGPADREVTLNTGTVLALFFTLALICAVFFGFGFSMGRKTNQAPMATAPDAATPEASSAAAADVASNKPAPGSPAIQAIPGYLSQPEADAANGKASSTPASHTPAPVTAPAPRPVKEAAVLPAAPVVRTPAVATTASSAPAPAGTTFVQIAAVSHQEDADVLKSALGRRGYRVVERSDAADKLIHVQIGPFADRKAAEVTRQKLLSDGYNAFLK